jgi:hypothetical protein
MWIYTSSPPYAFIAVPSYLPLPLNSDRTSFSYMGLTVWALILFAADTEAI